MLLCLFIAASKTILEFTIMSTIWILVFNLFYNKLLKRKLAAIAVRIEAKNKYVEFMGVVTCMRKELEDDQIGGTMTGRYKAPNLTARLNGITDNQNTKTEGIQKITIERISQDKG
jgi:hypothetical protein